MKNTRRGLGKGLGMGYKNIAPMDSHIHSLSAKGQKTYVERLFPSGDLLLRNDDGKKMRYSGYSEREAKKKFSMDAKRDLLKEISSTNIADRSLVKLMQRRLNDGKISEAKIFGRDGDTEKVFIVGADLERQGLDYLNNLRRTPEGRVRKNNPFQSWDEKTLDNFDHFELRQFHDVGNQYVKRYVPVWTVVAKDGSEFDYYWNGDFYYA